MERIAALENRMADLEERLRITCGALDVVLEALTRRGMIEVEPIPEQRAQH